MTAAQVKPQPVGAPLPGSKPSPNDFKMFADIRVGRELVEAAQVVRVTDAVAREYGITLPGDMSGLIFPYYLPNGNGHRATCRLRRDHPEEVEGKSENKYVCPGGDWKHLYFPPGAKELLADPKTPILFVEAEKSVLAMTAWGARVKHKFVAIATGGCWGWRCKTEIAVTESGKHKAKTGPSPELAYVKGRDVGILFDANTATNENVQKARQAFATVLMKKGARVTVLDLPAGDWNGPDDFIGVNGDAAMVQLLTKPAPTVPQSEVPGRMPITETSNADRFFSKHREDFRYCRDREVWVSWNGQFWDVKDKSAAIRRMQEIARGIYFEAAREVFEDRRRELAQWAVQSESRRTLENSVAVAQNYLGIQVPKFSDVFDTHPLLFNVKNGTVDLKTGKLRPHRREDFLTKIVPIDYDPDATCEKFTKFLTETFDENANLIGYMQRCAGYFLTGLTTEQCWWIFYGPTASGKSTLIKILHSLLGPYAFALKEGYFLLTDSTSDFTKANLAGVRLATCVETNEGKRLDVAKIKELTGEDVVSGEFKYQNLFEFEPQSKLLLATNHEPHVPAGDDATWRRLKEMPFKKTVPEGKRTPGLAKQLFEEEGPGILYWAVLGCLAWQSNVARLDEPDEVKEAVAQYRNREDEIKDFLHEFCVKDPDKNVTRRELYDQYTAWRKQTNQRFVLKPVTFGREISRIGIKGDDGTPRKWLGIRLRLLGDDSVEGWSDAT